VINLIEAFSVSVKHYLRGEDGIFYTDLFYLVKHIPAYALPATIPSAASLQSPTSPHMSPSMPAAPRTDQSITQRRSNTPTPLRFPASVSAPHLPLSETSPMALDLPLPATTALPKTRKPSFLHPPPTPRSLGMRKYGDRGQATSKGSFAISESEILMPALNPPKYHLFDLFPFSLLVRQLTKKGKEVKGKKAAKMRAKLRGTTVSHNLPLEISLYLVSGIRPPCFHSPLM
jgi:putative membrane protein